MLHALRPPSSRKRGLSSSSLRCPFQLARAREEDSNELASLDQVDRLLDDCRQLLDLPAVQPAEQSQTD